MVCIKSVVLFVKNWFKVFAGMIRTGFITSIKKDMEIAALRSQLALCHQQIINKKMKKPLPTPAFRQLWVIISKLSRDWESYLILVKLETVRALSAQNHYNLYKSGFHSILPLCIKFAPFNLKSLSLK
jgi:hypothetical protein